LSPSSISPGSASSSSTMVISAAANPPGGIYGTALFLPGIGLFAFLRRSRRKQTSALKGISGISALGVVLLVSVFASGCGGQARNSQNGSQANVVVTGTSGSLTHSNTIAVTIH
jgi:hypothetical protein